MSVAGTDAEPVGNVHEHITFVPEHCVIFRSAIRELRVEILRNKRLTGLLIAKRYR